MSKIYVIGIGYKPFDKRAREIILNSKVILASNRLFEVFKGYEEFEKVKDKVQVINNVDETIDFIRTQITEHRTQTEKLRTQNSGLRTHNSKLITLLSSGDPMFHGIGRRAVKEFGKDMVEILPDLSCVQIAFSRIKEPWDDAFLISFHRSGNLEKNKYEIDDIPLLLIRHNKIAILTNEQNNPINIAQKVKGLSVIMYVFERLGYPDEKIIEGTFEEIAKMSFVDPNVVIIQKKEDRTQNMENPPSPPFSKGGMGGFLSNDKIRFGLTESEIIHSKGLITKDEVRAITIHKLRLPQREVFWDIGAASGSISLEASRLCPHLKIFAIEKDKEQIKILKENIKNLKCLNIEVIEGEASKVIQDLPAPDRVFIGGSGGRLESIIKTILKTGCNRVVINAITFDTLTKAQKFLKKEVMKVEVTEVNISKSRLLKDTDYLSALNPIFIIVGEKTDE